MVSAIVRGSNFLFEFAVKRFVTVTFRHPHLALEKGRDQA